MAMPGAALAFTVIDSVVLVAVAIVLFMVVVAVTVVLMGLLQAVLPSGDSGAEAVHREELEAAAARGPGELDESPEHRPEVG
jgi:hypothetical protein